MPHSSPDGSLMVPKLSGDGHDDIDFRSQLGKNALYRNKAGGTFVEVAEAGILIR